MLKLIEAEVRVDKSSSCSNFGIFCVFPVSLSRAAREAAGEAKL